MRLAKKFHLGGSGDATGDERRSLSRSDDGNRPSFDADSAPAEGAPDNPKSKFSRVISMGKAKISKAPMNLMHNMPAMLRKSKDAGSAAAAGAASAEDVSPQEVQRVISLIDDFKLVQAKGEESMVIALSGFTPLTDPGVTFSWFRMNPADNRFLPIEGVNSYFYHTCADDIGCRICVQCMDAYDQGYSRFAETECITASSKLKDAVERHLSHSHIELPWTLFMQPSQEGVSPIALQLELKKHLLHITSADRDGESLLEIDVTGDFQAYAHAASADKLHILVPVRQVAVLASDPSFTVTHNQSAGHGRNGDADADASADADVDEEAEHQQQEQQHLQFLLSIASGSHRDVVVLCLKGYAAARRAGSKDLKAFLPWAINEGETAGASGHTQGSAEATEQVLIETDVGIAQETPLSGTATEPVRQASEDNRELVEELQEMQLAINMYKGQLSEKDATINEHTAALQALQAECITLKQQLLENQAGESESQAEIEVLQAKVENLSKELVDVQAKFETLERTHEQLEERNGIVEQQAAAASEEATRLAEELDELKQEKAAADNALASVQAAHQKLQEQLQVTQTQGEDDKAAAVTLREEVGRLEAALREAEARCEQLTEEKCGAAAAALSRAQELEQKEHELQQTTALLEQTKQELATLETMNNENVAKLQAAHTDSENNLQQIADLQAQVATLQAEKDELVGTGDLLQRVRELAAELDKTVGEKNHWMKKAESLTKDMQKMLKQASNRPGAAAPAALTPAPAPAPAPALAASADEIARLLSRIEELEQRCNAYQEAMHQAMEQAAATATPTTRSSFWG